MEWPWLAEESCLLHLTIQFLSWNVIEWKDWEVLQQRRNDGSDDVHSSDSSTYIILIRNIRIFAELRNKRQNHTNGWTHPMTVLDGFSVLMVYPLPHFLRHRCCDVGAVVWLKSHGQDGQTWGVHVWWGSFFSWVGFDDLDILKKNSSKSLPQTNNINNPANFGTDQFSMLRLQDDLGPATATHSRRARAGFPVNAASLQQTVDCLTRAELSVAVYVQSAENKTMTFGWCWCGPVVAQ